MNVNFDAPKPEIRVYYKKGAVPNDVISEVLLGIEEEGLPFTLEEKQYSSALELGYKAAEASHLGVGIGISDEIVLHFIKLKENEPIYRIKAMNDAQYLRNLGGNAARLVKRMPFKEVGQQIV